MGNPAADLLPYRGEIKAWITDRGFGFIRRPDGSRDVFVHIRDVQTDRPHLTEGDRVAFHIVEDKVGKMRAAPVILLDG